MACVGAKLTDDVTALSGAASLQLRQNVRLEGQRGHAEEEVLDAVPCREMRGPHATVCRGMDIGFGRS